ncbi:MAG: tRNA (adenosine(37)-N6)-threonylcarbamoyltransferase complex dimerization subunit type 1 TsaB [Elusimicrobiota bacterium]
MLALETSSPQLSLAAGTFEQVLATYKGAMQWRHAEGLFEGLTNLLRQLNWPVQSLRGVAVSVGPGSFTGIRIGLAAARTLGQTRKIPVVGVSALEALAFGQPLPEGLICPVLDALRGSVFAALYERLPGGRWCAVHPAVHWPSDRWWAKAKMLAHGRSVWVTGNALKSDPPRLKGLRVQRAAEKHWYPKASAVLHLAAPRLKKAGANSYRRVQPLYLREAAAQERLRG